MLNFRKPELRDRDWVIDHVNRGDTDGTCYSFGSIFSWQNAYSVEIAEYDSLMLVRGIDETGRYYVYPSGQGDIKGAVEEMMKESERDGNVFILCQLLPENKKKIEELFPDTFDFTYDRDNSEYVYSVKNMAELPGKSFHGKKGHVNAFFRNHTDIHIDPITDDNIGLCLEIEKKWLSDRDDGGGELHSEFAAIERALKNYKALGFVGAILFADGQAVAFTLGEPIKNNTFCTHFEKTLPEYRDAYPVINNGFTKLMLNNYDYVNREEDTGAEGLRKAKLSYNPVFLLDKYCATLKNEPLRKFRARESDIQQLKALWQSVFGDREETADYFLKNAVSLSDIYAYKLQGKIVSAFYLVDSALKSGSETCKAKYLYAAATLPEYRSRGYMGEMIRYAAEYLPITGCKALFLYPADESLYGYYARFGFKPSFSEKIYTFTYADLEKYRGERYFNSSFPCGEVRKNIPSPVFADFQSGYLDYALYCAEDGGFVKNLIFDDEDRVYLIGSSSDGEVFIDEAVSENGNYSHILSALSDISADRYYLKTPVSVNIPNARSETRTAGMLLPLGEEQTDKDIYLGLPCI